MNPHYSALLDPDGMPFGRSTNAQDDQMLPRPVAAMSKQYAAGAHTPMHSHVRAQLLYATQGVMRVSSAHGVWILPPRRALFIPVGVEHELYTLNELSMHTLYIEAQAAAAFGPDCKMLEVSTLLRELILALLTGPLDYALGGRGGWLTRLILSELASAETVPISIPWPRDRRSIEELAYDAGASARTLIRLFPKETGMHCRQWLQQAHLADAFCGQRRRQAAGCAISNKLTALHAISESSMFLTQQ